MIVTESELDLFRTFARDRIAQADGMTWDELFQEWRDLSAVSQQPGADLAAVRDAIRDLRGRPAGDVVQELREELGLDRTP